MNGFQCVNLQFLLLGQMIIELHHIRILNLCYIPLSKCIPDKSVIHIKIITLGRWFQIVFETHITVKYKIYCSLSGNINIQTVHLIFHELCFFFPEALQGLVHKHTYVFQGDLYKYIHTSHRNVSVIHLSARLCLADLFLVCAI